jgi:hypothetical protein
VRKEKAAGYRKLEARSKKSGVRSIKPKYRYTLLPAIYLEARNSQLEAIFQQPEACSQ